MDYQREGESVCRHCSHFLIDFIGLAPIEAEQLLNEKMDAQQREIKMLKVMIIFMMSIRTQPFPSQSSSSQQLDQ